MYWPWGGGMCDFGFRIFDFGFNLCWPWGERVISSLFNAEYRLRHPLEEMA